MNVVIVLCCGDGFRLMEVVAVTSLFCLAPFVKYVILAIRLVQKSI